MGGAARLKMGQIALCAGMLPSRICAPLIPVNCSGLREGIPQRGIPYTPVMDLDGTGAS
jgi:hypothetical protein